jgi:hypothetical protein
LYFVEWYSIAQETIRLVCDFIVVYNNSVKKDERTLINQPFGRRRRKNERMEGGSYVPYKANVE